MSNLSDEQLAAVILFQYEVNLRKLIKNRLTETLGPIAKGHAHFDEKMLDAILKIVEEK
jgi:hypothetical protein